ncbi:cytochrome P450 [Thalassospira marina]|uniref:Cytochrome n=1 Tax=Thalassospira marina TaxID=2048283 RepID=A0ABN5FLY9_9PROT|nr:cytochrome P450 [Thalassospira marina]AUG55741.1 cytochrome [Thalassospira marina]
MLASSETATVLRRPNLVFNPLDPEFRKNPYPLYTRLRREAPVLRSKGMLILSRYTDVLAVLKSRKFSVGLIPETVTTQASRIGFQDIAQMRRFLDTSIVFTDNPEHMRLRRLVNQAFSKEAIYAFVPMIEQRIEKLLDIHSRKGHCEIIEDIAVPLPIDILCDWMLIEEEARPQFSKKVHAVRQLLDPGMMSRSDFQAAAKGMRDLTGFLADHASRVGKIDDGNLVSRLCNARFEEQGLSDEEIAFTCVMAFVAGTETTQSLIGNIVYTLLHNPDQFSSILNREGGVSAAIEEITRYETPLQFTKRQALEDCKVGDIEFLKGEQVLLCLGAANRDETVFEDAAQLRLDRSGPKHVGFGFGMHSCLGALLAALQSEIFLQVLLSEYTGFRQISKTVDWQNSSLILRGPSTLEIEFSRKQVIQ